jgi:hypothetical protein
MNELEGEAETIVRPWQQRAWNKTATARKKAPAEVPFWFPI